jgi:protein gp37
MGEKTGIAWTDATVNFWWGCTKVGPGCDHCYAESWSKRTGGQHWGVGAPRRKIKGAAALLHRLDNAYSQWFADMDRRRRVFIQSMSDLFDNEVPVEWFGEAWSLIEACDRLEIQIVTKRISIVEKRLAAIGAATWPKHAGLLVTVCNQAEANRDIPRLLALKAKLGIPWVGVSAEPLLGPMNVGSFLRCQGCGYSSADRRLHADHHLCRSPTSTLDLVIVGGESGPGARPMAPQWARDIRDQCKAAGVAYFHKQNGEFLPATDPNDGLARDRSTGAPMVRVGKARAGRLLDGREHNDLPWRVSK